MADNAPALNGHTAVHTPLQAPRVDESTAAAADSSPFKVTASPWSFPGAGAQNLFSSLAATFGAAAPTPTVDYEKKVFDWLPPTPSGDAVAPPATAPAPASPWETPAGLPRPQPQMPQEMNGVLVAAATSSSSASSDGARSSESPIDVVSTSAFTSLVDSTSSPAKDDAPTEIVRPQPLRIVEQTAAGAVNPLLMLAAESQQQPVVTLASLLPTDTVIMSTEQPGPSSGDKSEVSPPSRGCYTRAPGLGPPPETTTPTSSNGPAKAEFVCNVCGFSCASKFHYNSHMNTHGDHQCTMCDYTSRTEGRLKKHMSQSHTVEEQLAVGLEIAPPASAASAAAAAATPNTSPTKEGSSGDEEMEDHSPSSVLPASLSSTLLGMIATSTASSMSSALEQMRAITEQPLLAGDGSTDGLLLVGTPLGLGFPTKDEPTSGGGGGRRKMKVYKCKQCPLVSATKEDQWAHARTHIPTEKQMSCDKCNFVTEYKHHLEYHQRNHAGIKPFQCKKCAYTCVNKSMLNSHMKSHSNVYQFRCADCNYATKYCHSLKLHLKKYNHRRNTEGLTEAELLQSMSAESSPPSMRKDSTASIASSLSGPFTPFSLLKREEPTTPLATPTMPSFNLPTSIATSQSLSYATQMLLRQHQFEQLIQAQQAQQAVHKCAQCDFQTGNQDELLRHNIAHMLSGPNLFQALGVQASLGIPDRSGEDDHHTTTGSPSGDDAVSHSNGSAGSPLGSRGSGDEGEGGASRRKSAKPTRIIDDIGQQLMDKASPDPTATVADIKQEAMDTSEEPAQATVDITASSEALVLPPVAAPQPQPQLQMPQLPAQLQLQLAALQQQQQAQAQQDNGVPQMAALRQAYLAHLAGMTRAHPAELFRHECRHCTIGFADANIHNAHMNYHHPENPMMCSRCHYVCPNPLIFNLHLLQSAHD